MAKAYDGQEALELIDDGLRPSLVIADLMMPRLTGAELAVALRARQGPGAPPVALMSANRGWIDDVGGVVAKLPKPFAAEALVNLVRQYVH